MAEARYCDGDEIVPQQCESISHPLLLREELNVDQVFFRGRTPPPGVDLASHSPEVRPLSNPISFCSPAPQDLRKFLMKSLKALDAT